MNIIVLVKIVPNFNTSIYYNKLTIDRQKTELTYNPDDVSALVFAKYLKKKHNGTITAISMAPKSHYGLIRKLYAYGVDKIIHVTDDKFSGSDTYATSYILSKVIKLIKNIDIIITGTRSMDGETEQVPASLAEWLKYPHICYLATEPLINNNKIYYSIKINNKQYSLYNNLPVILSVNNSLFNNKDMFMSIKDILQKKDSPIITCSAKDLNIEKEFNHNFSKTKVVGSCNVPTKTTNRKKLHIKNSTIIFGVIDKNNEANEK